MPSSANLWPFPYGSNHPTTGKIPPMRTCSCIKFGRKLESRITSKVSYPHISNIYAFLDSLYSDDCFLGVIEKPALIHVINLRKSMDWVANPSVSIFHCCVMIDSQNGRKFRPRLD